MAAASITIKLRCKSWPQLESIFERDLKRGSVFLKSSKPPAIGTRIRIDLAIPSDSLIILNGEVSEYFNTDIDGSEFDISGRLELVTSLVGPLGEGP